MATQPLSGDELRARIQAHLTTVHKQRERPRIFELSYDRTKLKSRNPVTRLDYQAKLHLWGTRYPDGGVGLSSGVWFETQYEMEIHFGLMGAYEVTWEDE